MSEKIPQYLALQCNDLPTSCVNYGVIGTLTGKEVCRVWDEGDCRTIADLLNEPPRPEPADPDLARKAASADRLASILAIIETQAACVTARHNADEADDWLHDIANQARQALNEWSQL
jgi:hypothetical protein